MSAHVLLNVLNKWGKRDIMRGFSIGYQRRVQQCECSECYQALLSLNTRALKRSPKCLQALAINLDWCFTQISKMATMIIMGFREGQYFQIQFLK